MGKSTISSQLAHVLAGRDHQADMKLVTSPFKATMFFSLKITAQIGLLDIDICGPSMPRIMGLKGQQVHKSNLGWTPV